MKTEQQQRRESPHKTRRLLAPGFVATSVIAASTKTKRLFRLFRTANISFCADNLVKINPGSVSDIFRGFYCWTPWRYHRIVLMYNSFSSTCSFSELNRNNNNATTKLFITNFQRSFCLGNHLYLYNSLDKYKIAQGLYYGDVFATVFVN